MKTKKRFLSILLSLVLVLGLMPGMSLTAYADSDEAISIGGSDASGTHWTYVSSTGTLTLNGYNYSGNGIGVYYSGSGQLTILVEGDNSIDSKGQNVGIRFSDGNKKLMLSGTGSLKITSENECAIYTQGDMEFAGGTIKVSGNTGIYNHDHNVTISGGKVTAIGNNGCGIYTKNGGKLFVTGGELVAIGTNGGIKQDNSPKGVVNSIAGIGWTDATGTDGKADIAISTDGQTLDYKKVQFPAYTVTYTVENGTWSDDSSADITETVASGAKPVNVPTGMKASEGYEGGAWDTDPTDTTITEAKTFTYTFTEIPKYKVTYKVVNGTWSDGKTADITETVQSGSKPASVPTGMKASEGYTGGAWNTDPKAATITEATTFTYAFTPVTVTGVTLDPGSATVALGGEAVKLTATVEPDNATNQKVIWRVSNGSGEVALYSDKACTKSVALNTATDLLTVYVKGVSAGDKGGIKIDADSADGSGIHASCFVTVTKESAVPATVTANNRTYDGTEKPLVTVTGTPTGGEMQYALGTDATTEPAADKYTATIPNGQEVGTYYVWYMVEGNDNYSDYVATSPVTVEIGKASAIPATVEASSRTYDGTEKALVTVDNSKLVGGTMWYALGTKDAAPDFDGASEAADKKWSESVPNAVQAGTYYIWYLVKGNENYADFATTTPVEVVISPAENPAVIQTTAVLTVGGNTLDLKTLVKDGVGAVSFTLAEGKTGGCTLKDGVLTSGDAIGTCEVAVTVAGDANYLEKTGKITVTLKGKETQTLSFEEAKVSKTFGDAAFVNSLSGAKTVVTYAVTEGTDTASVETDGTVTILAAGTATITATAEETATIAGATTSFTLTVAKVPAPAWDAVPVEQKPTAKTELVSTGEALPLITAPTALPTGYTKIQYSTDGGTTWTDDVPTGKDPGDYPIKTKYVADGNHTDFNAPDITVSIAKAENTADGSTSYVSGTEGTKIQGIIDGGENTSGSTSNQLKEEAKKDDTPTKEGQIKTVDVNLIAKTVDPLEVPENEQQAIQQQTVATVEGSQVNTDYLSLVVEKTVTVSDVGADGTLTEKETIKKNLTELGEVVELRVAYDMTGKYNPMIIRYHDGKAEKFTQLDGAPAVPQDGTFYVEGTGANTIIHVFTNKFSTYAIVTYDKEQIKAPATIVTAPAANTLTYTGAAQELVTAGSVTGGVMQYALGADAATAPTEGWGAAIPGGTNAGTYYVWYKAVGDETHEDTVPVCVPVTINHLTITKTVTFKVVNGTWDDDTAADKAVTLTGDETTVLKLAAEQIPAAGAKPAVGFMAGAWDAIPTAGAAIAADTVYTYTYAARTPVTATVTFKVVNGVWDDDKTKNDRVVTLTGWEGDELKLGYDDIPYVGSSPDEGFMQDGLWDVEPPLEKAITGNPVYTYTYTKIGECVVTFSAGGGKGEMAVVAVLKGQKMTLPECGFTSPDGKVFSGWDKGATGSEIEITEDTVITAQWKDIPVTSQITVLAEVVSSGKTTLKVTWNKVKNAASYNVYFAECGTYEFELAENIPASKGRSYTASGLKSGKHYKFYVEALDEEEEIIGNASPIVHAIAGGAAAKETNAKSVTVKQDTVTLQPGKTHTIQPTATGVKSLLKVMHHGNEFRYFSSNTYVATVDANGKITTKHTGNCVIYVLASNGVKTTVQVKVVSELPEETSVRYNGGIYELNKKKTAAVFTGATDKKATSLTIANTVKIGGKSYKVTEIKAGACEGMKKLDTLVIGKNVEKIGAKAFYDCGKLKNVTIKTENLKEKNIGADAFGKNAKKMTVKCPKSKVKTYKKWLVKKGVAKTAIQ